MRNYIKAKNPNVAQSVLDMVPLYISEGKAEGVRGDIAFAQSCLETGNFTFSGSAVTLSQNNFCGMGVTSNGVKDAVPGFCRLGCAACRAGDAFQDGEDFLPIASSRRPSLSGAGIHP